jgi:DNA-binding CsgD family transcriptional regulator
MHLTKLINSIHLLRNFITHFKMVSRKIIDSATMRPIALPFLKNHNQINELTYDVNIQSKFLSTINNIYSTHNITKREHDCIMCYLKGLSSKQIGKLLNISPKTVDRHFENIKEKLNLSKRNELFHRFPQLTDLHK